MKLQYCENALISMNETLNTKKDEWKELNNQLHNMFEQLCKSEYSISKFLKAVQDQDDLHENQIKFFQESEQLLKKYYQEKLRYCLQQIKLRDQPKVSVEIQTDDSYDRMIKENLDQHATKLGKPLNFQGCWTILHRISYSGYSKRFSGLCTENSTKFLVLINIFYRSLQAA